tara:strand:- start:319 stop:588 length:270 start_codon:yes stop_codon:yes gene_type:complete
MELIMDLGLGRELIFGLLILLCFGAVTLISYITKGKINTDGYAVLNAFLYLGLIVNLFVVISEPFPSLITLLIIIGGLLYRRRTYGRWI